MSSYPGFAAEPAGIVAIINAPVLIDGATWGVLEADGASNGLL